MFIIVEMRLKIVRNKLKIIKIVLKEVIFWGNKIKCMILECKSLIFNCKP